VKTYSPVVKATSLRLLIANGIRKGHSFVFLDVSNAYVNTKLEREVYVDFDHLVKGHVQAQVQGALYGFPEAGLLWNKLLISDLQDQGFKATRCDPCCLIMERNDGLSVAVYVDDLAFVGPNKEQIYAIIHTLQEKYQITLTENPSSLLGMDIDINSDSIKLYSQTKIDALLRDLNMTDCHPCATPMSLAKQDSSDEQPLEDITFYRHIVGQLHFIATMCRPDITYAVRTLQISQASPTSKQMRLIKRVARYLKGTRSLGLRYTRNSNRLESYTDASHAFDHTGHPIIGDIHLYAGSAISWSCKSIKEVMLHSTEAEFVAAARSAQELVFINDILDYIDPVRPTAPLYIDNLSALYIIQNQGSAHQRTKHISIKYHFVQEKHQENLFELRHIATDVNPADLFTKPLGPTRFNQLRRMFMSD
jgi:hypothetical protein